MTLPPPSSLLAMLRDSVELIAAEPADQEHWYVSTGFSVDEIAEQFHDDVLVLWQLEDAALLTPELVAALRALDDHFDSFSGPENAARWQVQALYADPAWKVARMQARTILEQLDAIRA